MILSQIILCICMTDTNDIALLELPVAVLLILGYICAFVKNTFAFSWQFLRFHNNKWIIMLIVS